MTTGTPWDEKMMVQQSNFSFWRPKSIGLDPKTLHTLLRRSQCTGGPQHRQPLDHLACLQAKAPIRVGTQASERQRGLEIDGMQWDGLANMQ